jgi:hypothetical protein
VAVQNLAPWQEGALSRVLVMLLAMLVLVACADPATSKPDAATAEVAGEIALYGILLTWCRVWYRAQHRSATLADS